MRIQDQACMPHVHGYIYAGAKDGGDAMFSVTKTYHASPSEDGHAPHHIPHEVEQKLAPDGKIKVIPIKVQFDSPMSNISARYEAWTSDSSTGPVCIGDGDRAKAYDGSNDVWQQVPCRGPQMCSLANQGTVNCSLSCRMAVTIDAPGEAGRLYELRTNSMNTYRSIVGSLSALRAAHGSLRSLPLQLELWLKSTRASDYEPFVCSTVSIRNAEYRADGTACVDEVWEQFGASLQAAWMKECEATPNEQTMVAPLAFKSNRRSQAKSSPQTSTGGSDLFASLVHIQQGTQSDTHFSQ